MLNLYKYKGLRFLFVFMLFINELFGTPYSWAQNQKPEDSERADQKRDHRSPPQPNKKNKAGENSSLPDTPPKQRPNAGDKASPKDEPPSPPESIPSPEGTRSGEQPTSLPTSLPSSQPTSQISAQPEKNKAISTGRLNGKGQTSPSLGNAAEATSPGPASKTLDEKSLNHKTQMARGGQPEGKEIEEIIVTTERRNQNIQKVAGNVQAFLAKELQTKGVGFEFRNLQVVVPGLQITNQEGQLEVFLRGIGSTNNDFSSDPAVATHYNGVYISRPRGIGPMFFDLERVEVNKGPQGTLRGRNATGGTINIISKRPDLFEVGGFIRTGLGNYNSRNLEAAINIPLIDSLALRGAVFHQQHSSYYSNALNNGVEAPGKEDDLAFRVSALWEPTDRLSVYVIADVARQRGTGDPGQFFGGALSAGYDVHNLHDARDQFFLQEGDLSNDLWGLTGVISYDFGPVIAEYNAGFRSFDFFNKNAQRPFQQGVNYPGVDISKFDLDNFGTFYQLEESNGLMQEIRAYSPDSSRLRWTGGAFYYRESFGRVSWDVTDQTLVQNNLGGQSVTLPDSKVESFAFYGDGTFDVTDSLRIKGGARFTNELKKEIGFQAQYTFDFGPAVQAGDVRSGTPGFALKYPSELSLTSPHGHDAAQQFLDAVSAFGARDTLDDFIAQNPNSVSLSTTDPEGTTKKKYEARYVDWRGAVEYDLTRDNMLYAMVSTGTRSGGINPTVTLPDGKRLPVTFQPEKLLAVEIGSKNRLVPADLQMLVNLNGFFYRYTNQVLQTMVAAKGSGANISEQQNFLTNANVGSSNLFGLELSGRALLPLALNFDWNVAYLNSRYDKTLVNESRLFQEPDYIDYDGDGDTQEMLPQVMVNLEGGPLQNTSTWNLSLTLHQEVQVKWALIDWTINYMFRSEFFYTPYGGRGFDFKGNEIPLSQMTRPSAFKNQNGNFLSDRVPSSHIVNLSAGLTFGEKYAFRASTFVANLTNETFTGKGLVNPFVNIRYLNVPRTFGAQVSATF